LKKPRLNSTLKLAIQPNMMHVTGDGKRMYITNSLLSTMDRPGQFWVKMAHVGPDGMKLDPDFHVDLNGFKTGPARGHDLLLNGGSLMLAAVLLSLSFLTGQAGAAKASRLAVIEKAPAFALTDQSGKPLASASLKGKVWLVSFIFTTCNGSCPATTHRMGLVQRELQARGLLKGDRVRLVSITLDPKRDTPEVLRGYMRLYDADPASWSF